MMSHTLNEYYKNKKILITGGTGYLGFSLAKKLSSIPCEIILLSRHNNLPKELRDSTVHISITEQDVKNPSIWPELLKDIDIIFHFAAQTSSKFANENPQEDMATNLLPMIKIIEACQKYGYRPDILFSATSTQVGFTEKTPVNESLSDQPITIYDINKLAAEKYLLYYTTELKGRSVSLRLTNVYGPGPASSKTDRGILNLMVKKALQNETLTVFGTGNYVRDYIYIDDVVSAFLTAGEKIDSVKGKYFVLGSGVGYTIKSMVEEIARSVKNIKSINSTIQSVPMPEGISRIEFRSFVADTTAFHQATGWEAEVSLSEGIEKTVLFFSKFI